MKTDNAIRVEAINILIKHLGPIETEKFISMINREKFDYTKWQKELWNDKTIEEIHQMGVELEKNRKREL
jgi:hypothetical protein